MKALLTLITLFFLAPFADAQTYPIGFRRHVGYRDFTFTVPHYDPALDPNAAQHGNQLESVQIELCWGTERRYRILFANSPGLGIFDMPHPELGIPEVYSNLSILGLASNHIQVAPFAINYSGFGVATGYAYYTQITDSILTTPSQLAVFTVPAATVTLQCHESGIQVFDGTFGEVGTSFRHSSVMIGFVRFNP